MLTHTRAHVHTCTPVSPVGPVWSVTFFPSEAPLWSRRAWGEIGQFNPPSIASFFPSWALTASLSLPFSCPCWLVCPTGVYLLLSLCLAQHPPWQCKAIIFLFSLVASLLATSLPLSLSLLHPPPFLFLSRHSNWHGTFSPVISSVTLKAAVSPAGDRRMFLAPLHRQSPNHCFSVIIILVFIYTTCSLNRP